MDAIIHQLIPWMSQGFWIGDHGLGDADSSADTWRGHLWISSSGGKWPVGSTKTGVIRWDPYWGDQTMQMYGNFEGFPLYSALFGVVI